MDVCGQISPWQYSGPCVREKGHGPKFVDGGLTPKRKKQRVQKVVVGTEHMAKTGQVWPVGKANLEYA